MGDALAFTGKGWEWVGQMGEETDGVCPVAIWLSPHKPPRREMGVVRGMAQQDLPVSSAGVGSFYLPPAGIAASAPVHRP